MCLSRHALLVLAIALAGCGFDPRPRNGQLPCNDKGSGCPSGYHCATDHTCWKDGTSSDAASDNRVSDAAPLETRTDFAWPDVGDAHPDTRDGHAKETESADRPWAPDLADSEVDAPPLVIDANETPDVPVSPPGPEDASAAEGGAGGSTATRPMDAAVKDTASSMTGIAGNGGQAGGATQTGGFTGSGGVASSGGTTATGGAGTGSGGASSTGGVSTVGGASTSGGASSTGGVSTSGGVASTGGVSTSGGASSSGGMSSTGGSSSAGGSGGTGGTVFTVKADIEPVLAVATNGRAVVWTEKTDVKMCPVAGCGTDSPKSLMESRLTNPPIPNALALDATYAYWLSATSTSDRADRCPFTGCPQGVPETLFQSTSYPLTSIKIGGSDVYVSDLYFVYRCPAAGCSGNPVQIFGIQDPWHIRFALDKEGIYFDISDEAPGVYYCAFGSCPPKGPPILSSMGELAAFGGTAYLVDTQGKLGSCPNTGCSDIPTPLATSQTNVKAMVADGSGVYWLTNPDGATSATGKVSMCTLPTCAGGPRVLARNQANPVSIAVTDGYLFWANQGLTGSKGSVMGMTK